MQRHAGVRIDPARGAGFLEVSTTDNAAGGNVMQAKKVGSLVWKGALVLITIWLVIKLFSA